MARKPSKTELERMTRGDSRNDLLRKIGQLIEDVQVADEHARHTDEVILKQNLHLAHLEKLVKAHHSGERRLEKAHIERAFALANPKETDTLPKKCPDCGGDLREAGFGYWVCDNECGFRVRKVEAAE